MHCVFLYIQIVNIAQNIDFEPHVRSLVPTLLKKSHIWRIAFQHERDGAGVVPHEKLDRPLAPLEYLAAQGVPVQALLPVGHEMSDADTTMRDEFEKLQLSASEVRALAGNSMHISALGSVIGFRLLTLRARCVQPAESA